MANFEIVNIPNVVARKVRGEFNSVLDEARKLTDGKCIKLPRLTSMKSNTLRMAARTRGLRVAIHNTDDATYIWLKAAETRIHGVA